MVFILLFFDLLGLKRATKARFLRLLQISNASLRDTFAILGSAQNLPAFSALWLKTSCTKQLSALTTNNKCTNFVGTFIILGNAQKLTALFRSLIL
ncbi:hypothetical protein BTM29_06400 [Companilactobacillus allii]|uniref:Uncharacterized protein n=1 Tax=Companilactobacillus allii TaxID=1847728 RepID=A0A1P8Q2X0_9LACO|nr:hypothetical protein BTM29_06400 [Companilactobacillus allii]